MPFPGANPGGYPGWLWQQFFLLLQATVTVSETCFYILFFPLVDQKNRHTADSQFTTVSLFSSSDPASQSTGSFFRRHESEHLLEVLTSERPVR